MHRFADTFDDVISTAVTTGAIGSGIDNLAKMHQAMLLLPPPPPPAARVAESWAGDGGGPPEAT